MKRRLLWIVPLLVVLALVVGVLRALDKRRNEQAAAAPARETLALDLAPGDVVTARRTALAKPMPRAAAVSSATKSFDIKGSPNRHRRQLLPVVDRSPRWRQRGNLDRQDR